MFVYHFRLPRRLLALGTAAAGLIAALVLVLSGCHKENAPIAAATEAEQLAYLQSLGWTVKETPVETLDLVLPDKWDGQWVDYVKLQQEQGLPFSGFAGRQVRRCTYALTNYPGIEKGVQANLYICDGQLIGGDIISTGQNSFMAGLAFPEAKGAR